MSVILGNSIRGRVFNWAQKMRQDKADRAAWEAQFAARGISQVILSPYATIFITCGESLDYHNMLSVL